ncbi:7313_t:CDS:2 [Funneliformis mosseae]|uniref:7313_t:CDS:1 n=1 Tax=Funneliformis mosseae TaxID=27381 RepID=A0A9N8WF53_FUNMO|nr:7313_t:CDS:2 [Funneliformis mosseae]
MFNAATLYFYGIDGNKDEALGKKYMIAAAYKQHKLAIEYCKKHGLPLKYLLKGILLKCME